MREHAVACARHRVHADEERGVDARLEVLDVLRPLVLHDVLAVGIELLRDQGVEGPALAGAVAVHDDDLRGAAGLRTAHGGVDLTGVEAARLLVHRVAARDLLPLDDPGDAFHVADHEDLHRIEPTTSPSVLRTSTVRNDSMPSTWPIAGRSARVDPSSTLNAQATPSGSSAVRRPSGAALRHPAGQRAHQVGVVRASARRRAPGARASRLRSVPGSWRTAPPSRRAAVRRSARRSRRRRRRAGPTSSATRCCSGCDELAIRVERPAVCAAGGEHPGVLARAVVPERAVRAAVLRAALEVADLCSGAREQLPHRGELRRLGLVRGARDRELVRRRGRRSPRASGTAWIGFRDERRKQWTSSPSAVPSVDRTCTRCTASTTSPRCTVTLIASTPAGSLVAGVARGRSLAAPARPTRQAIADRESRPGAHRDAQDLRPAALDARRRGLPRRRAPRQALPAADRRRRARRDGAPDERGPAQVRRERREGARRHRRSACGSSTAASCS